MKLYLICGKARAGKDTFAKLIKQEEEKNNNKVCILKLTAPLYSWAEDYFNYDKENMKLYYKKYKEDLFYEENKNFEVFVDYISTDL